MTGQGMPGDGPYGFGDAAGRLKRLRDIQDVVGSMRQPVEAPDLTAAILSRVEQERPFVPESTRRLVWISRLATAASICVAALGVALLHRSAPHLVNWTPRPQPLSDVVQSAQTEASSRIQQFRVTLSTVGSVPPIGALHAESGGHAIKSAGVPETIPMVAGRYAEPSGVGETRTLAWSVSGIPGGLEYVTAGGTGGAAVMVPLVEVGMPGLRISGADERSIWASYGPAGGGMAGGGGYWAGRLSTAPAPVAQAPVVFAAAPVLAPASLPAAPERPSAARRTVNWAAPMGADLAEPVVPR